MAFINECAQVKFIMHNTEYDLTSETVGRTSQLIEQSFRGHCRIGFSYAYKLGLIKVLLKHLRFIFKPL